MSASTRKLFEQARQAIGAEIFREWSTTPWPLAVRCRVRPAEVPRSPDARPTFGVREVLAFATRREREARADGDDAGAEAYAAVVTFIRG